MDHSTRLVLGIVGGALVAAGTGYALVEAGVIPNPFAPKPPSSLTLVVKWPQTFYQAKQALLTLSVVAIEHQNTAVEANAHLEAQAIRTAYPGAGPTGGYTCQDLVQLGMIDSSYCTQGG